MGGSKNEKALPVGIEDFKKIIDKKYYYIDKTLFIKELLDNGQWGKFVYQTPGDLEKHWP